MSAPCLHMLATILAVYGAWDDAPTAWRILPAEEYDNDISWYVRELEVYASPGCTGDKIAPHKTLGSLGGSDSIVDGNVETPWNTRTLSSKFAARAHYVGFQVLKANALHGNCVKLNQGSLHGGTSGLARMIVLQERVDSVWFDVTTFKDTAEASEWFNVTFSARPPRPPWPPAPPPNPSLPPPPPSQPPPPPSLPASLPPPKGTGGGDAAGERLSVGAIVGIAAGGAVALVLGLGICGISIHISRKMNRELKQAKHVVKPAKPPPGSTGAATVGGLPVPAVQGEKKAAAIELP